MFKIEQIQSGWFNMTFDYGEDAITISASNVGGYDVIKMFVKSLSEMVYGKLDFCKLYFNGETELRLLKLQNDDRNIIVTVDEIDENSSCFVDGQYELSDFAQTGRELFCASYNCIDFYTELTQEFCLHHEDYDLNWSDFPKDEIESIQKYIQYRK